LDSNLKGNLIRQYFIDNFSSETMFHNYQSLVIQ